MRSFKRLLGAMLAMVLGFSAANGHAEVVSTDHVEAELVSDTLEVAPGSSFVIALRQKIIPNWHTYWINPGDSGEATQIDWELPRGFQAGPIQWPIPEKIPVGPLINYGYADEIFLLSEIFVPDDVRPGPLPIKAHVKWLVCEEICIPEEVDLKLTLRVADSAAAPDLIWAPTLRAVQDALPATIPWDVTASATKDRVQIFFDAPSWEQAFEQQRITRLEFFPAVDGVIRYAQPQTIRYGDAGFSLDVAAGYKVTEAAALPNPSLAGVLRIEERGPEPGSHLQSTYAFEAQAVSESVALATVYRVPGEDTAALAIWQALLFAFVGGLLLNLMPCVFPVLSMKALSFLQHVHGHETEVRRGGLAYGAGVLVSFLVLACVLLVLRSAGDQIGWGFQLQSPIFVALIAYLIFLIGLNLTGMFDIGARIMGVGSASAQQEGLTGSFATGVLAVIVATPCTAPFMGAALGFALFQPALVSLLIFLALGAGLAAPYVFLCFAPHVAQKLPKPGPWMVRVKQILAVPMFATVVWLLWVLSLQATPMSLIFVVGGLVLLTSAAWLYGASQRGTRTTLRAGTSLVAVLVALGLVSTVSPQPLSSGAFEEDSFGPAFEPYSFERLQALRASGIPVFVNFTAAWCITCLVNERVVFSQEVVRNRFENGKVAYLKGDWTNEDPYITEALARYDRVGVPLYLLYPAGGNGDADAHVLPQILTPQAFLAALDAL